MVLRNCCFYEYCAMCLDMRKDCYFSKTMANTEWNWKLPIWSIVIIIKRPRLLGCKLKSLNSIKYHMSHFIVKLLIEHHYAKHPLSNLRYNEKFYLHDWYSNFQIVKLKLFHQIKFYESKTKL